MEAGFVCPHCGTPLDVTPAAEPQGSGLPELRRAYGHPGSSPLKRIRRGFRARPDREDELSGIRIRQLAAARRASYRARSHCVVGALVCVVAGGPAHVERRARASHDGLRLRAIAYLLVAGVAAWGATYFFRKAIELDREANGATSPPVAGEPDFAPLSDGSQQWKNLDEVR
jgi:hypothetical protein